LAAVATVVLFDSAAAVAAPPAPPPVPLMQSWTGFYLGGSVGTRSSQTN